MTYAILHVDVTVSNIMNTNAWLTGMTKYLHPIFPNGQLINGLMRLYGMVKMTISRSHTAKNKREKLVLTILFNYCIRI